MNKMNRIRTAYCILRIFGYLCAIQGMLGLIGYVGSFEQNKITFIQFCLYEIHSVGLIGLSYISYNIRKIIKKDYFKRSRH